MNRQDATLFAHESLIKHGLNDWHVRISITNNNYYLGLCSYKDKCIILNAHHLDIHPEPEIKNTILHEIAHALCPGMGHNAGWELKAKLIGCTNTAPCSHLALSPDIIDAIRSGANVKIIYEEDTIKRNVVVEEKITRPKYEITQLRDKCPHCGKDAIETRSSLIHSSSDSPDKKMIFLKCGHLLIKTIPKGTPFETFISNNHEPRVRACKHVWEKNKCNKCFEFKPFPFQVEGMRFIETSLTVNKGVLICDEMGLGKTIQMLGYLFFHQEALPVLFVVKSALKFQFFKEALKWLNIIPQVISSSQDHILPMFKAYIISYDIMVPKNRKKGDKIISQGFDISRLESIKTVVLDECQQIKNVDSTRTQQVRRIVKDKNVIALSGTPWKNRGSEYFSILNMMAPQKFPSFAQFSQRWVNYYQQTGTDKYKEGGIRDIERFKEYTKDLVIRREVSEVMKEMPDVNRTLFYCDMDNVQQQAYDDEVSAFVKWYNEKVIGGTEDDYNNEDGPIIAKLSRMRHITGLAKIPVTVEWAETFYEETDRKLVIFVHHKDVASILFDKLKDKFGQFIPVLRLTGEQTSMDRFETQEKFNKSERAFLVASTLAAGEGLNLQTCSDAIVHERQWNPANEDQAAPGRFRRIGQLAHIINVIFMTASGSIDDLLAGIVEKKRSEFHDAMNQGAGVTWSQGDVMKELIAAIVAGHNKRKKAS